MRHLYYREDTKLTWLSEEGPSEMKRAKDMGRECPTYLSVAVIEHRPKAVWGRVYHVVKEFVSERGLR